MISNKSQLLSRFKDTQGLNTVLLTDLVETTIKEMGLQQLVRTLEVTPEGHYKSCVRGISKLITSKFGIITVSIQSHHSVMFTITANDRAYLLHLDSLLFGSHKDYANNFYDDYKNVVKKKKYEAIPIKTLQNKVQTCNWRCGLYVYKFVRSFLSMIASTDSIGEDHLCQYLQSMTKLKCRDAEDFDNVEQIIQMYTRSYRSTK
ncbi:hypothetical protein SAMD00019534_124370 [Acytostelium subglobosum LB1]|nr:hypothetical protein SAMD00019534_124370 [Acytostelium subglobosum LB1]GAM29261.1 hypothetical protein SAMD00019534_124370 [Acytostelium subglobosum LB1]|eukprot:XP_012747759.1 hypothetical protein SAMD00019534_124370 [Acytostelium subglobosum LB1]